MKKIFTLIAASVLAIGVQAQTYSFAGISADAISIDANGEKSTTTMDEATIPSVNYTGSGDYMNVSFSNIPNVKVAYKNGSTKNNILKFGESFLQVDGKNGVIIISNLTAGELVTLKVSAKGSTASVFEAQKGCVANAANPASISKAASLDEYVEVKFEATADEMEIKETAGGFRVTTLTICNGGGAVTPSDPTPAKIWNFSQTSDAAKSALAGNADWTFVKASNRYTYNVEIAKDTYVDLASIGFADGAGIEVGRSGGKIDAGNLRIDIDKRVQINASNGVYKIKNLVKGDKVAIRCASASSSEAREFAVTNADISTVAAPTEDYNEAQLTVATNGDVVLTQTKGINLIAVAVNTELPTSGITTLKADAAKNGAIYNLAGQKVANSYKGVAIMNGKKVVMK